MPSPVSIVPEFSAFLISQLQWADPNRSQVSKNHFWNLYPVVIKHGLMEKPPFSSMMLPAINFHLQWMFPCFLMVSYDIPSEKKNSMARPRG